MNPVASILRRATINKLDKLNILTYPTHERYQSNLTNTNVDFYLWQGPGIKTWNSKYAKLPSNHILLNPEHKERQLPNYIVPDVVFSQNKLAHFQISAQLATRFQIPLINLEHCLPWPGITNVQMQELYKMQGDVNIFITDYSRRQWGFDETNSIVIEHGIDTEIFKSTQNDKKYDIISVANDFKNRNILLGWDEHQYITQSIPYTTKLVGDNPGYSTAANNVNELIQFYNESKIFLCTAKHSPIPYSLIEAMSCGLPPVCYKQAMVAEVIEHGYNGFISDDIDDLKDYCVQLLEDEDMRKEIGKNARQTVLKRFRLENFVNKWEQVFRSLI